MVFGIFKRSKKKEKVKEKKKEDKKQIDICDVCKQPIYEGDSYRTINFGGQKLRMHIKCFRQLKKTAKQLIRGGEFGF